MSEKSAISWTRSTFNPWWGCTKVSPGCDFCYAERDSKRYGHDVWGSTAARRFFSEKHWNEPLRWNKAAQDSGEYWPVFCASMADHLEDRRDLDAERQRLYALIERTPALTWLLLTKRPENAEKLMPREWFSAWPAHVKFGITAEDQERFDKRWLRAVDVPADRWISYEPAIGPIAFGAALPNFRWVIVGGESHPSRDKARPFDLAWARDTIEQCGKSSAPFVKQLGSNTVWNGSRVTFPSQKADKPDEWPADLNVQVVPWARRSA